ncbi:hypothetical protein NDU88_010205 [Pleurodeles waltl]|uniref:Uncharacterized protein n=1 Tax=Pleurodeles waltl TaxID=8319 RepID=A0AAV7QV15_PLEWA|nr:hypothetical protein NDU88_010205 [Pleurodeles waltl]
MNLAGSGSGAINTPRAIAPNTEAKLDHILKAIAAATKQELSRKVESIAIKLGLLQTEEQKLVSRVTHMEHNIIELRSHGADGTGALTDCQGAGTGG